MTHMTGMEKSEMTASDLKNSAEPLALLKEEILAAVSHWKHPEDEKFTWREPLLAVASAEDPLFPKLREVVDPAHAMPSDLVSGARSALVFFLPFHRSIGQENDREEFYSSTSWAKMLVETNLLIGEVCNRLKGWLETAGYHATTTPATYNFDEQKLVSLWSHKHIGYIAGLGTFGLHRLLITEAGCCGRLGSIVTDMPIPPSPRPNAEWCLTKSGKHCLACVTKCTFGALQEDNFDRHRCYDQTLKNIPRNQADVCGKCGCEVPCSYQIPAALQRVSK